MSISFDKRILSVALGLLEILSDLQQRLLSATISFGVLVLIFFIKLYGSVIWRSRLIYFLNTRCAKLHRARIVDN